VDVLLIDVAGVASVSLLKSAGIADLVIIPAHPNEDDFIEAINTKEIVKEAEELTGRAIPCKTVITRAKAGTTVLEHTAKQLEKVKFPLFSTIFYDRTIFAKARFMGATPISYGSNKEAIAEIKSFSDEVHQMIFAKEANTVKKTKAA
jgi:cellulose biosynthesis protein BcsQ